jgi:aminoglycoside phosphotransferase (APT) family kinase protein
MNHLIEWLPKNIPNDNSTSIAHGDYRLENTIIHPNKGELVAVLDWELCTIGHLLADLGYNCMLYHYQDVLGRTLQGIDYKAMGIPFEQDYVDDYCKRSGRTELKDWNFYLVFSFFRLASILQGVYKRGLDGNASSEMALNYKDGCKMLSEIACNLLER